MASCQIVTIVVVALFAHCSTAYGSRPSGEFSSTVQGTNLLGIRTWCGFCESATAVIGTRLLELEQESLVFEEVLGTVCHGFADPAKAQCENMISVLGTVPGRSGEETGVAIQPSCSLLPVCKKTSFLEIISENQASPLAIICATCKLVAAAYIKRIGQVVGSADLETILKPFCAAISAFDDPEKCVKDSIARFQQTYASGTILLSPEVVCSLYGVCAFAAVEPSPSPKKPVFRWESLHIPTV